MIWYPTFLTDCDKSDDQPCMTDGPSRASSISKGYEYLNPKCCKYEVLYYENWKGSLDAQESFPF